MPCQHLPSFASQLSSFLVKFKKTPEYLIMQTTQVFIYSISFLLLNLLIHIFRRSFFAWIFTKIQVLLK